MNDPWRDIEQADRVVKYIVLVVFACALICYFAI